MNSKLIISAAIALTANAFSLQCSISDYSTYLGQFALGFQSDTGSLTTDCYIATDALSTQIETLTTSINNFAVSAWLDPLYDL